MLERRPAGVTNREVYEPSRVARELSQMRPLARSLSWTACGLPAHTPATTGYQTPHRAQSGRPPTLTGQRRLWTRLEQVFPSVKHMFDGGSVDLRQTKKPAGRSTSGLRAVTKRSTCSRHLRLRSCRLGRREWRDGFPWRARRYRARRPRAVRCLHRHSRTRLECRPVLSCVPTPSPALRLRRATQRTAVPPLLTSSPAVAADHPDGASGTLISASLRLVYVAGA